MARLSSVVCLLACLFQAVASARADDLAAPTGPVIVTVTGNIAHHNAGSAAVFDRAMLEALGPTVLKTTTPWTDGVIEFEGASFARLLDAVGATGAKVKAVALNDYTIELDVAELRQYPVLLALKMNGAEMRVRDKGPIWVVYPRDSFPELNSDKFNYKWIWQLKALIIN